MALRDVWPSSPARSGPSLLISAALPARTSLALSVQHHPQKSVQQSLSLIVAMTVTDRCNDSVGHRDWLQQRVLAIGLRHTTMLTPLIRTNGQMPRAQRHSPRIYPTRCPPHAPGSKTKCQSISIHIRAHMRIHMGVEACADMRVDTCT